MKQHAISKQIFASIIAVLVIFSLATIRPTFLHAQGTGALGDGTCVDGKDNDGDGRADWDGAGDKYPPDPSCVNKGSSEVADEATGSISPLIPCVNKCDLGSVFALINNLISFLIKVVLFPIAILMFVYAGYKYITAQGNPSKKANVKKMIGNLILGMVIILTAWVVVKTVLVIIGYDNTLYFFE